jgi:hypothetical protein
MEKGAKVTEKETILTERKDSGDILSVNSLPKEALREPGYSCISLSMSGDTTIVDSVNFQLTIILS